MRKVRLKNSVGMFVCSQTGFKLVKDEVRELPHRISDLIRSRLNGGALVYVDEPVSQQKPEPELEPESVMASESEPKPEPKDVAPPLSVEERIEQRAGELVEQFDRDEIKSMATKMGIDFHPKTRTDHIAGFIAEKELGE